MLSVAVDSDTLPVENELMVGHVLFPDHVAAVQGGEARGRDVADLGAVADIVDELVEHPGGHRLVGLRGGHDAGRVGQGEVVDDHGNARVDGLGDERLQGVGLAVVDDDGVGFGCDGLLEVAGVLRVVVAGIRDREVDVRGLGLRGGTRAPGLEVVAGAGLTNEGDLHRVAVEWRGQGGGCRGRGVGRRLRRGSVRLGAGRQGENGRRGEHEQGDAARDGHGFSWMRWLGAQIQPAGHASTTSYDLVLLVWPGPWPDRYDCRMTLLTVWDDTNASIPELQTRDAQVITDVLATLGARFSRWELKELTAEPTQEEVLAAYRDEIEAVNAAQGYTLVDVVSIVDDSSPEYLEQAAAARQKFLSEHRHDDDEDRFFARGSGVFYLRANGKVNAVFCEAGDVISVPANTTHWFDMGTRPEYVSVRFFHDDDGWVGNFTGSEIAKDFATYDELAKVPA
jgi:1,2-dihydroxy-3-keto-5-methylthiopentene dioxygenase